MSDWSKARVTILGLGRSGVSAAEYLASRGAQVYASDSAPACDTVFAQRVAQLQSRGVRFEFGGHSDEAIRFGELVLVSPGIAPGSPVMQKVKASGKPAICDVELAFRETDTLMIAVTGTNGKSTTCALVSHILTSSGYSAPACGNFGVPVLSQLESPHQFLVVEVSSFQLEYCNNFSPFIAVWLNLTPDHFDWHGGVDNYRAAKEKLFANQKPGQYAVMNMDDPVVCGMRVNCALFPFSIRQDLGGGAQGAYLADGRIAYCTQGHIHKLCRPEELQIKGAHNVENVLAAVSVAAIAGVDAAQIEEHLKSFKALAHRLEYAGTIAGVSYYNDSKATNVSSTLKALSSFPGEKVVLIAGGRDKGTDLSEFVEAVKDACSMVILVGEAKNRFAGALNRGGFSKVCMAASLEEAVDMGQKAGCGPVVLSPACASYDMFKNYEERGDVFKDLVRARSKA